MAHTAFFFVLICLRRQKSGCEDEVKSVEIFTLFFTSRTEVEQYPSLDAENRIIYAIYGKLNIYIYICVVMKLTVKKMKTPEPEMVL